LTQPIKRIVVSLDAVSDAAAAIDTAARLAARWQVPLHGLFFEDAELIGVAGLPFACQVTLLGGREPLSQDHLEDHFRAFAQRARRELAEAARRLGVEWSFEVVRCPLTAAAFASAENEFVVAGAATRPVGDHLRIASPWWSLAATITRPFLLAKRRWDTGGSVLALVRDRGPQSARLLEMAAQIAGVSEASLIVAPPSDVADREEFEAWVFGLLEEHPVTVQTEPAATEPADFRRRIIELDCRLLVLAAHPNEAPSEILRELFEPLACDVLIVR
jgi:hypothetical protein